jgi:ketosteroid isomerase-like protein
VCGRPKLPTFDCEGEVEVVSTSLTDSHGGDVRPADENREAISRFFAALSEGRYQDAEAQLVPGATVWKVATRDYIDPGHWLSGFAKVFPDGLPFELEGATSEGETIAVRARARGVTSTGREFDNAYHFLFEIEGGAIRAAWEYGDTLHAERVFRG